MSEELIEMAIAESVIIDTPKSFPDLAAQPQTLQQEFALINVNIPNVTVEQVSGSKWKKLLMVLVWNNFGAEWFLNDYHRAVFKWLSKVIMWLWLLRLVIGSKDHCQFFNQWESKPKPITPCTCEFSRASSELQVIARDSDWFITLSVLWLVGVMMLLWFWFFDSHLKPALSDWMIALVLF